MARIVGAAAKVADQAAKKYLTLTCVKDKKGLSTY